VRFFTSGNAKHISTQFVTGDDVVLEKDGEYHTYSKKKEG
jgi:hypothetical protein